jgi:hypothetical protein
MPGHSHPGLIEWREPDAVASRDQDNDLEREILALDAELEHAKAVAEANSRAAHWGKAPERPWSWDSDSRGDDAAGAGRSRRT